MCECQQVINVGLEKHNVRLAACFSGKTMKFHPYLIQTEKVDEKKRSKRAPLVLATFCPFCGEKLKKE